MGYSFRLAAKCFYMDHSTERIAAFVTPVVEYWLERPLCMYVYVSMYVRMYISEADLGGGWGVRGPGSPKFCELLYIYFRIQTSRYFSFQPVLHDWCNKGRGMCYPVCGMVHIKEPLLLIDKSSLCGGSGFPFSLSEWSLTICLTPYNRR